MTDKPSVSEAITELALQKHGVRTALRDSRRARRAAEAELNADEIRETERLSLLDAASQDARISAAKVITSYEPMRNEPDVSRLNDWLLERAQVLVPLTLPDLDLAWKDLATGEEFGLDGIARADLVLAPAMAVSVDGVRIGKGGGCYDKSLPRRRENVPIVAIVFDDEFGEDIPRETHDQPVDAVLSPSTLRWLNEPSPLT